MPAPLLIADVPWLLYRSFFALPKSIVDGEGRPVNALLGTVNAMLALLEPAAPETAPRAVVACMGAEQADYRVRALSRPTTPTATRCRRSWPRSGRRRPRLLGGPRLDVSPTARSWRPTT